MKSPEINRIKKAQEKILISQMKKNENIKDIVKIVETFLIKNQLLCYGGTAINNLLPKKYRFYSDDKDIPDYDFFSTTPIKHAKQLADLFFENGFSDVEAKVGVHNGTYKVYVNFIGIADITYIEPEIFKELKSESIEKQNILYVPSNYLLMMMYNELSRPEGNISRWEKVFNRFSLFVKHYPIKVTKKCINKNIEPDKDDLKIFRIIKDIGIKDKVVFFGGYARLLYSKYDKSMYSKIPDFHIISSNYEETALKIYADLRKFYKNIKIIIHENIGEHIPENVEIIVNDRTVAFVYDVFPGVCYNYNTIEGNINVATIDTILSIYIMFTYVNKTTYDKHKLLCACKSLFRIQNKYKLKNIKILRRFNLPCIGYQITLRDLKTIKTIKFYELKSKNRTKEYEKWFMSYVPYQQKKNELIDYDNNKANILTKLKEYIKIYKK